MSILAAPLALNRIKGAASRSHAPLSGVRLPTSTGNSPRSGPSSTALGKRRESSTSPPPFARSEVGRRDAAVPATPPVGLAVNLDTLAEFGIPPISTGPCAPSVQASLPPEWIPSPIRGTHRRHFVHQQAKLANFHNLRLSRGLHFNDSLHASKAFRNPRIYAKLVEFVDVDETGSNWDKEIWDAKAIGPDASSNRLGKLAQICRQDRNSTKIILNNILFFSRAAKNSLRSETVCVVSALFDRVCAFNHRIFPRRRRSSLCRLE